MLSKQILNKYLIVTFLFLFLLPCKAFAMFSSVSRSRLVSLGSFVTTARPATCRKFSGSSKLQSIVKSMSPEDFHSILTSADRSRYQIIDVREQEELVEMSISGNDIIHLPLSNMDKWSKKVLRNELLDSDKTTLCLCKMGGRSFRVSTFLGKRNLMCIFPQSLFYLLGSNMLAIINLFSCIYLFIYCFAVISERCRVSGCT
jgi:rhodanese-related sulfurtransferase